MEYLENINGTTALITISGKFTFSDNAQFKRIFTLIAEKKVTAIEINLKKLEFIDSAALGLLLLLRDETNKNSIDLSLISPEGTVKKMFELARFSELFNIR